MLAIRTGARLGGLVAIRVALVGHADIIDAGHGDAAQIGRVVVVGIDTCLVRTDCERLGYTALHTDNLTALDRVHILHDNAPSRHVIAVPTAPVYLAKVLDIEARHTKRPTTIMLQHLILRLKRTTTGDSSSFPILLLLDRKRILTHRTPPHIRQRTGPKAMHALDLVRPDNHVGQRAAVLDLEHGVAVVAFILARAGLATVVHDHAAVEGVAGRDGLDGVEGGGSG